MQRLVILSIPQNETLLSVFALRKAGFGW